MRLYNYDKTQSYTLTQVEAGLTIVNNINPTKLYTSKRNFDIVLEILGLIEKKEHPISTVNRYIIGTACQLNIRVDVRGNLLLHRFEYNYNDNLYLFINEELNIYISEYKPRLLWSNLVSKKQFEKTLNTCIKIFGEDLCRKSAFTYAQPNNVFEYNGEDGTVTLTGNYFNGKSRPDEGGLFMFDWISEKEFKFRDVKTYNILEVPTQEIYNRLNWLGKRNYKSLYLTMNPNGEWWISDGLVFDGTEKEWVNYSSDFFSPFWMFDINPIDNFTEKCYLRDLKPIEQHDT
jgi:hypothetical protein